jgi:hypothetical protein
MLQETETATLLKKISNFEAEKKEHEKELQNKVGNYFLSV